MTDQKDPHWGKGGRYQIVDGKRVRVMPEITPATAHLERTSPGTGEPMTPVEGDTLTVAATDKPAKKGK